MKQTLMKIVPFILILATIGCAGCKSKVQSGGSLPPGEESQPAGTGQDDEAGAAAEGKAGKDIQNVYWSQVAGQFYPMFESEVKSLISDYMGDTKAVSELETRDIVGLISPHAGYPYSGPVAAWGYRQLEGRKIGTVIILGFNHNDSPSVSSVLPYDGYKTPLGIAKVDKGMRKALLEKGKGVIEENKIPFSGEHSLEVQIPFIQTVLPDAAIVPIMVAHPGGKIDEALARLLFETAGGRKDVVIIASTDLSHYTPYDDAVATDTQTLKWIAGMDLNTITTEGPGTNRMCGYFTVGILIKFMSYYETKDKKGTLVKYANSGDTSGDKSQGVVGYGVVAFTLPAGIRSETGSTGVKAAPGKAGAGAGGGSSSFSPQERTFIVEAARKSIEDALSGRATTPEAPPGEALKQTMGSIVVIELDGRIQGTGRELSLSMPLYESVAQAARNAVLADSRYPTPPADSVPEMTVSVYAVSEVRPVEEFQVETIGGDGYLISSDKGVGVVPPQEPAMKGWKTEDALKNGCRRANLMVDCYKESNRKSEKISFTTLKGVAL